MNAEQVALELVAEAAEWVVDAHERWGQEESIQALKDALENLREVRARET